LPGRRVRTTAQRPWIEWAYARSDRFPPRGVTPLTPIMGRATDPGENHDPGKDHRFTPSLTQEPRLENGLGQNRKLGMSKLGFRLAPIALKN
jgi:hypothetical protein